MGGSAFTVDSVVIGQKAEVLDAFAEEYGSLSLKLKNVVDTMGSAYDTEDYRTYIAKIEELSQRLKELEERIRSGAGNLRSQASDYDKRQEFNKSKANALP